MKKQEDI